MIKPWIFEIFFAPGEHGRPQDVSPAAAQGRLKKAEVRARAGYAIGTNK